jgi:hypothetical protein
VRETLELLLGTAIGFVLLRPSIAGAATITLDFDRVYATVGRWVRQRVAATTAATARGIEALAERAVGGQPLAPARASAPVGYAILLTLAALALLIAAGAR